MNTKIIKIDPAELAGANAILNEGANAFLSEGADALLREAADVLRGGGLVAFPTETVYGLGASVYDEAAMRSIYAVKGRPDDNPIIVHIDGADRLDELAENVSPGVYALARRFWPGPLTMVLQKRAGLPGYITSGLDTIALRAPSHPVAAALIKAAGAPIAAPSANISGKPSPTIAAHVVNDLYGKIDMIIDAGPATIGLESTVLDMTQTPAVLLRPGGVPFDDIAAVIGANNIVRRRPAGKTARRPGSDADAESPRSPGVKYKHYAPNAPMLLYKGNLENITNFIKLYMEDQSNTAAYSGILASRELITSLDNALRLHSDHFKVLSLGGADETETAAKRFYGSLREFDRRRVEKIYCEYIRAAGIGDALSDRMIRAAGGSLIDADEPAVLFVCTGNTCRSAIAEALFNDEINKLLNAGEGREAPEAQPSPRCPRAVSAGLMAGGGTTASIEAVSALRLHNIDLSRHRSQQLAPKHVQRAGIILTMTEAHKNEIIRRFPPAAARVFTLAGFMEGGGDIDDPFGRGPHAYQLCANRLRKLVIPLARKLTNLT